MGVADECDLSVEQNAASPFLRLPGEIRNEIYGYAMEDLTLILHGVTWIDNGDPIRRVVPCKKTSPAVRNMFCLPRVCRQVYSDTYFLRFRKPTIVYLESSYFDTLSKIPESYLDLLTTVIPSPSFQLGIMADFFPALQRTELCARGLEKDALQGIINKFWGNHVEIRWHEKYWHETPDRALEAISHSVWDDE